MKSGVRSRGFVLPAWNIATAASTKFVSTWKNPAGGSIAEARKKVATFVLSPDESMRRGPEESLADEPRASGTDALAGCTVLAGELAKHIEKAGTARGAESPARRPSPNQRVQVPVERSGRLRRWLIFTAVTGLCCARVASLSAQQPPASRTYTPDIADEDWSFLRDQSKRSDVWDPLKYISLGGEDRYLTLSTEIRYRVEGFRIRGVGEIPSTVDSYLLQRYLAGADLHLGPRFRVFTEFQSGIINGQLRSPRPSDQDTADIHQGFLEWKLPLKGKSVFGVKAGRQELSIGNGRLISASPGLNVKRSFDGIVLSFKNESWRLVGAFAKLVSVKGGAFDDQPDHEQTFWGFAASRKSPHFKQGELSFLYLDVDRAQAAYNQGVGRDQRRTAGVHWFAKGPRIELNWDAIFQWGVFKGEAVRAWAFSSETAHRFAGFRGKPRLSLRADFASGDRDRTDPRLQSFNPLFPGNSYAGAVGLLGPTNLTDLTPAVNFVVRKNLILGFESPSYWRTSTGDGVYSTDLKLLLPAGVGPGKYVGTNPGFVGVWQATRHVMIQGAVTRFLSGAYLHKTFVANGFGFYSVSFVYRI